MSNGRSKSLLEVKQMLYVDACVQTAVATYSKTNVTMKDLQHLNTTLKHRIDIQYINILHKVRGY